MSSPSPAIAIEPPRSVDEACALFSEYAASLGIDLFFQGFDQELASLPRVYAPPKGMLLIARASDFPVGCIALRPLDSDVGEVKRLYVRPQHRGMGIGACLVAAVLAAARARAYSRLRLDTLPTMNEAIRLYRGFGFQPIAPYRDNPVPGALFFELDLMRDSSGPVVREIAEHYTWGDENDGWHLVRRADLSVIQERMRPGTCEVRHLHRRARQFFFILSGRAALEVGGLTHQLEPGQGLEIASFVPHQIANTYAEDLHFIVVSSPPSHGDRVLITS